MTLQITLLDRSLYFKGLLLLARKDKQITPAEISLMAKIGRFLDFEPSFCEITLQEILGNEFIADSPPVFSNPQVATRFIRDGLTLGSCDHEIMQSELDWLDATAKANQIDLEPIAEAWKSESDGNPDRALEAEHLVFY